MGIGVLVFALVFGIGIKTGPSSFQLWFQKFDLSVFHFFYENLVTHCTGTSDFMCGDKVEVLYLSVTLVLVLGGVLAIICALSVLFFPTKLNSRLDYFFQNFIYFGGFLSFLFFSFDLPTDSGGVISNISMFRRMLGEGWFFLNIVSAALAVFMLYYLIRFNLLMAKNRRQVTDST